MPIAFAAMCKAIPVRRLSWPGEPERGILAASTMLANMVFNPWALARRRRDGIGELGRFVAHPSTSSKRRWRGTSAGQSAQHAAIAALLASIQTLAA
jgi:hypothetical protein